jgi:hypothetical protein
MKRETQGEYHLKLWEEWLPAPQLVYLVQGDPGTPIKVGLATSGARARIAGLQTGNPQELRLLHILAGNRTLEWNLHTRLKEHRVRGEWFDIPADELVFIEQLADWMVDGYREGGKVPDYHQFGQWFLPNRKGGDPPTVRFVDPETIRPEKPRPKILSPEERIKETARAHPDSPFNPIVQAIPTFAPHKPN